ncbi:GNAT family N-acetyltransferase [Curtanaerobium respiraculi]|uniref:GNAT family N-acetyltransferase n=1 Tax=Curtanaerobium respiraculi TaxID=2949669 RepID=UPI0024B3A15D|nr:GNAT family N-acetyltransferase [Curtanaerobium respiraculi]
MRAVDVWSSEDTMRAVRDLMGSAFPEDERMPVDQLVGTARSNPAEFKAFYDDGEFCGFALWMWRGSVTYLLYLAVSPAMRSKGIGGKIVDHLKADRPGDKILLEMQSMSVECDNRPQREARLRFYERHGFHQTGVRTRDAGVVYDVLCSNGDTTDLDECRELFGSLPGISLGEIEVF